MEEQKVEVHKIGSSDYIYINNKKEFNIGIKNYKFTFDEELPSIISNYFISGENSLVYLQQ
jgi:hypothetical protein